MAGGIRRALLLLALVPAAAGCAAPARLPALPGPLRSAAGPASAAAAGDWDDAPAGGEKTSLVSVGLFAWVPTFNGSLTLDGFEARPDGDPLVLGTGVSAEFRSEDFVGVGDLVAMRLDDDLAARAQPGPDFSEMRQRLGILEFAAGPRLLAGPGDGPGAGRPGGRVEADLLFGLRFVQYRLRFRDPVTREREDIADRLWGDPTVGARLEWSPLPALVLGVRGDAGIPVMSGPTWQVLAGFALGTPGKAQLTAGFRALRVDYEDRSGHFHVDALLAGPWLGFDVGF
jgi:hypothetical protein